MSQHPSTSRRLPATPIDETDTETAPSGLAGAYGIEALRIAAQRGRDRIMGALCAGTLGLTGAAVITDSPDSTKLIALFGGMVTAYFVGERWSGRRG